MSDRDFEAERRKALAIAEDHYKGSGDLDMRFGPGTVGWHELWDRIHVQQEVWETHVATHPATTLDARTYELTQKVSDLMGQLYQHVGSKFPD